MNPLLTIIAELEEAERAATPGPWDNLSGTIRAIVSEDLACPLFTSRTPVELGQGRSFNKRYADAWRQEHENARLIALMRTHLPTLIEALKRSEALQDPEVVLVNVLRGTVAKVSPSALYKLYTEDELINAARDVFRARAALKEAPDV